MSREGYICKLWEYSVEMSMEDASILALDSIHSISEEKTDARLISMAQIDAKTKRINFVQNNEIEKYTSEYKENASKKTL